MSKKNEKNQFYEVLIKLDYVESIPFNPPFLDPTAVMEEVASWAIEFSSEFPPPEVKRSPIKDIYVIAKRSVSILDKRFSYANVGTFQQSWVLKHIN